MENKIKNSETYLNSILSKKNSFSIPDDYFSTIENTIEAKIVEENFRKENGFKTPDSYFNGLENDILAKVSSTKKETKVISLKQRFFKVIPFAAAASIILFIGFNSFMFNKTEKLTLDSLSDDDVEYWLNSNSISNSDIVSILEDDVLEDDVFYFSSIEDETIEDYINSIDNVSLLNELN
jgi:hypothetical protein